MSIGQRIKELRTDAKLSQKELAEKIKVSRGNVGDWELEKSKPGADALIALSSFFDVSTDWILSGGGQSSTRISEQTITNGKLSPADIEFLAKFHQLPDKEQGRIEERIEMILEQLADHTSDSSSKQESSALINTEGSEEAATKLA